MSRRSLPVPSHSSVADRGPQRLVSRRTLLATAAAVPILVVIAACGDDTVEPATSATVTPDTTGGSTLPGPGGIDHPTDPDTAVVRIADENGFMVAGGSVSQPPRLVISGDGMLYTPGVITMQFPGPMIMPVVARTITEAGIQQVLESAQAVGLLAMPPDYPPNGMIADAPDTVVTLTAAGGVFTHRANALGMDGPETDPGRAALQAFVEQMSDVASVVGETELGAESILEPAAYRMIAMPVSAGELSSIDPAPTVVPWPASTGVNLATASGCATLTAAAAGTVFTDADSNTFFEQDGVTYRVAAGAFLPGDPVC